MSNVIVVWNKGSARDLEKHIPLIWGGERNRKLGSSNSFHLIFLEGLADLDPDYRAELTALGYLLIDGSGSYRLNSEKFHQLDAFGDYEKKCFLRWTVIQDIFGSSPVMHYDGDVVFNTLPEQLESDLGELTFVLQGCPAFVSTGQSGWLQEYIANLYRFAADVNRYSSQAWTERQGWEESCRTRWSGSRFRKLISSDQDLISHLIHTGRLPQSDPAEIKSSCDAVFFENPLYFFVYAQEGLPVEYRRSAGIDFLGGKKVAFWHMQSDFIRYLTVSRLRSRFHLGGRCPVMQEEAGLEQLLWRTYLRLVKNSVNRIDVYRHFFDVEDFSTVFTDTAFWKQGICSA